MSELLKKPPSLENLIQAQQLLIKEFDPKKMVYLDSKGQWKKNPVTMRDRISNELLHHLGALEEEKRTSFIQNTLSSFIDDDSWLTTKIMTSALLKKSNSEPNNLKMEGIDRALFEFYSSDRRAKSMHPALIILEVLIWILEFDAVRINSKLLAPVWDIEAKVQQQEYSQRLQSMTGFLDKICGAKETDRFISNTLKQFQTTSPETIKIIPQRVAEEDRLMKTINRLLEKAEAPEKKAEIYSFIVEKIQPPLGIADQTSPALLRPCLQLLMDSQIEIESGIQYNASVILSILQDPRSVETLLDALNTIPLNYTKIRENLIYTLGNLNEKKAVKLIIKVLEGPDTLIPSSRSGEKHICSLNEQKEEAILALGKIGLDSLESLPQLIKYEEHPSAKLKICLSWTLGEIGKAQKENSGGVSADIIITLLRLLKYKDRQIFEESVSSLKKIKMPEFIHALYLYNVGAVSILGLKPSQRGLYELSETLHFLIKTKKRAILAVNGDSGTGKTYFCQSIIKGFGDVKPEEILYLMRDRKRDQKIFNRMIGLKWLKKYIDPVYYHDYPLAEEEDNPEEFFRQFLEENSEKKIILLDGCRDQRYFQRVIDLFYFRGELDVIVNFRATFSTRRLNLEERETALESVKTHLSFLEEPAFEETFFYREGIAMIYYLDNSMSGRLNSQETQELFEKGRIDSWGDLIRIGNVGKEPGFLNIQTETISIQQENFIPKKEKLIQTQISSFIHQERKFKLNLNRDLIRQPNLLGIIEANDLKPEQIRYYAQDQVAGIGEGGNVFVLTFLDNRIFHVLMEQSRGITLLGREIFLINNKGKIINVSFERNETLRWKRTSSPALVVTSFSTDRIITGHKEGSIRIWDFSDNSIQVLEGHNQDVLSMAADYFGCIYSTSADNSLRRWNTERGVVDVVSGHKGRITQVKLCPEGKILIITETETKDSGGNGKKNSIVRILDLRNRLSQIIPLPFEERVTSVHVYFDGRIIMALGPAGRKTDETLAILRPGKNACEYHLLPGHQRETKDCLTMGPRIISCGVDKGGERTIRLSGTEYYVKTELSKLSLQPS